MTQLNDIITDENGSVYADAAVWCNQNGAMMEEIEPLEKEVEEKYYEMTDDLVEVEKTRTVKKTFRRFKVVPVPEPTAAETRSARVAELENYLNATDWYAVRYAETGTEIPEAIRAKRQAVREEISRLRDESEAEDGKV